MASWVGPLDDRRRYTLPDDPQPVATGGQGFVYRAERTADGLPVALKRLTSIGLDDWPVIEHRARLVAGVTHPSLGRQLDAFLGPSPFGAGEPPGADYDEVYLVTAWIDGVELTEARQDADLAELLSWVRAVGHAADALHRHPVPGGVGIVHRDIKPSNVLIGDQGAVLVDLGVARPADGSAMTAAVGTPGWLPPEAHEAPGEVGPASDLWQVAGLASWAVTGESPGRRMPARHRRDLARALAAHGVPHPRRLARHIDTALATRPADRPTDLRRWCDELAALAPPAGTLPQPAVSPVAGRRRVLVATASAAAVAVAAAGVVAWTRPPAAAVSPATPATGVAPEVTGGTLASTPPLPAPERCQAYDPATLDVASAGPRGWVLTAERRRTSEPAERGRPEEPAGQNSDRTVIARLDDEDDARRALSLARQADRRCEIGGDAAGSALFGTQYWKRGDQLVAPAPVAGDEDCHRYDPDRLRVVPGEAGLHLIAGDAGAPLLVLGDQLAARQAEQLARQYRRQCFIGRNNARGDPAYRVDYWRP
jgi:hypothetical protein